MDSVLHLKVPETNSHNYLTKVRKSLHSSFNGQGLVPTSCSLVGNFFRVGLFVLPASTSAALLLGGSLSEYESQDPTSC